MILYFKLNRLITAFNHIFMDVMQLAGYAANTLRRTAYSLYHQMKVATLLLSGHFLRNVCKVSMDLC